MCATLGYTTHVWQTQQRGRLYLPLLRHPFCRYRYRLIEGRPFDRYGLEQQAEIVRHAFLLREGVTVPNAPAIEPLAAMLPFDGWRAAGPYPASVK